MKNFGVFFKVNTQNTEYRNDVSADKTRVFAEAHRRGSWSKIAEKRLREGEPLYIGIDGWVYGEYVIRSRSDRGLEVEMTSEFEDPVQVPRNQRNLYLNGPFMDKLNAARVKR